ncbi:MAG: 16S rRNA (cytosine(1402)-N(4))-methyltransferase RsmH [bacterium]|nr:16S rRNA (cytosine(1402)-N(4))-methyltransferase RsmH [bacterium]
MHISVLLKESINALEIKEDGIYVDCTLGYGGHSSEILKRITKGFLYCFDQDIEAVNYSDNLLKKISNNYKIINNNFEYLQDELKKDNVFKVDGILFDLGVSSKQLDDRERGFSYHDDATLDMRMNQKDSLTARDVVNNYNYKELVSIFYKYGEEKYSPRIASNIVKYREKKTIETTKELVDIIKKSVPIKAKKEKHPARKVFQAIRIEVNRELEVLEKGLRQAIDMLNPGGIICVITFHSLEDRIVKNIFKEYSEVSNELKKLPFIPKTYEPILTVVNKKVLIPSIEEIDNNKRSRSAKMRIVKRK